MNAASQIQRFNAGRDPERLQMKYRAMRTNPFVFLRGTCHLFYDRLPRGGVFKSAPLAWVCGDLHLENFGSYKADNRLAYFDLNDFDESALAPASWDLVRFLTSLQIGADSLAVTSVQLQRLCHAFVDAYASALALGKAYWVERDTADGLVRALLDDLRNRSRVAFLESRTALKGKKRLLRVDGKKALPATPAQRAAITDFMHDFAKGLPNPDFYAVRDVARRIAGTGSLGVDRYAILVEGKGSTDAHYILDLKLSLPSSLLPRLKVIQPAWESEATRVVALQRRVQAVSMAFLQPVNLAGVSYVLRGLQPSEDRVTLDRSPRTMSELEQVIGAMGRIVAWGQLRSAGRAGSALTDELIEFGQHTPWKAPLLDASQECVERVRKDWKTYCIAFDDGTFRA